MAPDAHPASPAKDLAQLVIGAMEGSRTALRELVDTFHGAIFGMAYTRTRSSMDAEDLTQDIFLAMMQNLSKLRDPSRFRPWLFSIAVNKVRDHLRTKRIWGIFRASGENDEGSGCDERPDPAPDALGRMIRNEFWQTVERFSKTLSYWEREVFFLRFTDDLSIREISQALNKSESSIKTHLYRALRKFRDDPALAEVLGSEPYE